MLYSLKKKKINLFRHHYSWKFSIILVTRVDNITLPSAIKQIRKWLTSRITIYALHIRIEY